MFMSKAHFNWKNFAFVRTEENCLKSIQNHPVVVLLKAEDISISIPLIYFAEFKILCNFIWLLLDLNFKIYSSNLLHDRSKHKVNDI